MSIAGISSAYTLIRIWVLSNWIHEIRFCSWRLFAIYVNYNVVLLFSCLLALCTLDMKSVISHRNLRNVIPIGVGCRAWCAQYSEPAVLQRKCCMTEMQCAGHERRNDVYKSAGDWRHWWYCSLCRIGLLVWISIDTPLMRLAEGRSKTIAKRFYPILKTS